MRNRIYVSETRLYRIWQGMIRRCSETTGTNWEHYGSRGITVCPEWYNSFSAFEEWAYSNGYREYFTIDRIENDGNYCPENCRWADASAQRINQRRTRFIEINGESHSPIEWARITEIPFSTICDRLRQGETGDRLIRPLRSGAKKPPVPLYEINGVKKSAADWAGEIGIGVSTFHQRWKAGLKGEALLKPSRNRHRRKALPCEPGSNSGESR